METKEIAAGWARPRRIFTRNSEYVSAGVLGLPLFAICILFLRRPEMFLKPQLSAEDACVFFLSADQRGVSSLWETYAGYHHFLLRAIAWCTSSLSAVHIPTAYFLACMGLFAGICIVPLLAPNERLPAAGMALPIALLPHTGEVMGNLTNLQWLLGLVLVWLLIGREPRSSGVSIGFVVLSILLGVTGLFACILAPLFLLRAFRERRRYWTWLAVVIVSTAAVQFFALVTTAGDGAPFAFPAPFAAFQISGLRLVGGLALPASYADRISHSLQFTLGLCLALCLCLIGLRAYFRKDRLVLQLVTCVGLFSLAPLLRCAHDPQVLASVLNGDRYYFIPKVLLVWLLWIDATTVSPSRWVCRALLFTILVSGLISWRYEPKVDYGWSEYALRIDRGEYIPTVQVNPPGMTFTYPGRASKR